ncbi:hypothetical protein AAG906_030215 [Vitis piasezkii]
MSLQLSSSSGQKLNNEKLYRGTVGALQYLRITRPEISYILLGSVSLASQMPVGPVVSMVEGSPVASVFFFVLTLSHGIQANKRLLQGPACLNTKHWITRQHRRPATCIAANPVAHAHTKHIFYIQYAPTEDQIADILTKPLSIYQSNVLKLNLM